MEGRRTSRHSIIRYMPSDLKGEVINVGVVLHSCTENDVFFKYHILDENSSKLKSFLDTSFEVNEYRSFKNVLEYYFSNNEKLLGDVGEVVFASTHKEDFLEDMYKIFMDKKMFFSEPTISRSSDFNRLFTIIHDRYIGKNLLQDDVKNSSIKRYVRQVFEEEGVLDKKVKQNLSIHPIKELEDLKINIDFSFKNGVWNYLQAVPTVSGPTRTAEWFAKINLLLDSLEKDNDTMVHLIYRSSELNLEKEMIAAIDYFLSKRDGKIVKLDLDDRISMKNLLYKINNEAHDFEKIS